MKLKTHDGHEVDSQTHRLIIAFDVLEQFTVYTGPLFRRPVLEWNWKNGKRFPYVNLVFLGYEIQFGWIFDEIPKPGRDVKPPRIPHSNCFLPCVGGSPLPKPEPRRLVCGFVPPTPGYAPCTRDKGHDGPCAHDFARPRGVYPKRSWF